MLARIIISAHFQGEMYMKMSNEGNISIQSTIVLMVSDEMATFQRK